MTGILKKTSSKQENSSNSVAERFEQIVKLYPDKIAVKSPDFSITYRELDIESNKISNGINTKLGEASKPVAMLVENGIKSITTLFGIIKSGNFYISLDSREPINRLSGIVNDAQTNLIVTDNRNAHKASAIQCQTMNIDEPYGDVVGLKNTLHTTITPDSLLGIYYTSGTTGEPKGVMTNHRNMLLGCCNKEIPEDQRFLSLFSYSFSASGGIFITLLNGGTLNLYPQGRIIISDLINYLIKEEITIFHPPVSLFRQLTAGKKDNSPFQKIKVLHLTGQSVYHSDINSFKQHFSKECQLIIGFSLNESGSVMRYIIDRETKIPDHYIPLGYPNKFKEVSLLDNKGNKVGVNEVGEIAVRSRYLSPGYWCNPELTREKFLSDPDGGDKRIYLTGDLARLNSEGYYEYMGRKDFQVKIRGFRIETEAIDAALYSLQNIKDAVVVSCKDQYGENILVAYVVPLTEKFKKDLSIPHLFAIRSYYKKMISLVKKKETLPPLKIMELRLSLSRLLPNYMIPTRFVILNEIPLTANGKVNRKALPKYEMARHYLKEKFVSPKTELECELIKIWEKVLNVKPVGIEDNFFELGGHSLLAVRLITEINKSFSQDISTAGIYKFSTVKEMATMLKPGNISDKTKGVVNYKSSWLSETEYIQMQGIITSSKASKTKTVPHSLMMRMNTKGKKPPLFWCVPTPRSGQLKLAKILGKDQPIYGLFSGSQQLQKTISENKIIKHYIDEILSVDNEGPYFIGGNCNGAKLAWQIVLRLNELGKKVERLFLMEYFHDQLYDYEGKLLLLYGDRSHLKAYKPFHWLEDNWQKAFKVVPHVSWIPGAHGEFFKEENFDDLGKEILTFLAIK